MNFTTFGEIRNAFMSLNIGWLCVYLKSVCGFKEIVRWGIVESTMNNYMSVESNVIGYYAGKQFTKGHNEIWPISQIQIDLSNLNSEILKQT